MKPCRQEEWLRRLFKVLMALYPQEFRGAMGKDLEDTYVDRMEGLRGKGGMGAFLRTAALMVWHSLRDGTLERMAQRRKSRSGGQGGGVMAAVPNDARHAFRALGKKPAFYATVLLVFAIGIGANTVMFSVVNGVLLQPLPFPEPDRLVVPYQTRAHFRESDNPALRAMWDRMWMSYPTYEDWLESSPVFQEYGLYLVRTVIADGGEGSERIRGTRATRGLFGALGAAPHLGRIFLEEEDRLGGPHLVVLSHGLWVQRYGGDPAVLGESLVLDEEPHTIVGVMPEGFDFPGEVRLWTTFPDSDRERGRNNQFAESLARLRPGATMASAQRDMEVLQEQINEAQFAGEEGYGVNLVGLHEETVGDVRSALSLLLGSVAIFLAIACANITSLLLLRAAERRKELAVRLSLGAGKKRILGQLLTEGFVLSLLGGSLGILLSVATIRPFLALFPANTPRLNEIALDGRVLVFSVLLSLVTGLMVSVIPGFMASRADLSAVMKSTARGTFGGRGKNRTQGGLLVAEIALTFVLLVGAGLLARSFSRLTAVDPGFSSEGVIVMKADVRGARYAEREALRQAYDELTARIGALPGVISVGMGNPGPFAGTWSNGTAVETVSGLVETNTQQEDVSATYFETMGIPLLAGRIFTPEEYRTQDDVVMVNAVFGETYWPGEDPLGKRVKLGGGGHNNDRPWLRVVGVVGDVRKRLEREPYPTLFHPEAYDQPTVVIKAGADPAGIMAGAREVLRAVDPGVPLISMGLLDQEIGRTVAGPKVRTLLLGAFSGFAMLLAVLGIFGLLAYAVAQRTGEIGIRMALGAPKKIVLQGVLVRGLGVLGAGLLLGLAVTLLAVRFLEPFLFEVGTVDPVTMGAVALLLSLATLGASVIPARRAMRVDPVEALRAE